MGFAKHYDLRKRLVDAVELDLAGCTDPEEVISDPPITRYVIGILYPRDSEPLSAEQDVDVSDDCDEAVLPDPPVAMANVRYPSSMGMTFAVDSGEASTLRVEIGAGRYEPVSAAPEDPTPATPREGEETTPQDDADETEPQAWQRTPVDAEPVVLNVGTPEPNGRLSVADGLELFHRIREADDRGVVSVTLVLLNTNIRPKKGLRDAFAFFQAQLSVSTPGREAAFVARPRAHRETTDADLRTYDLLYRHAAPLAVGHGCSVQWEQIASDPVCASVLKTTYVPRYELLLAGHPDLDMTHLDMKSLATGDRAKITEALTGFCSRYETWIEERQGDVGDFDDRLRETAEKHLEACGEAVARMAVGVRLLAEDDTAWRAFQLANKAMLQQRARTDRLKDADAGAGLDETSPRFWYPFQLAFILLCLKGTTDPQSPDRDCADLLWFPTGGGKTEAYLGLIAYTIFLRRLRHGNAGAGVTVIMRYTLRLLTIQQFERAALLVCGCEAIRRSDPTLGDTPISIGLWVGRGGTPNSRAEARTALDRLRRAPEMSVSEGNPVQLHRCPWCGTELTVSNYYLTRRSDRLIVACKNRDCLFEKGLPVFVVDEDVYDWRPTLLISTVDKFACLPWRESASVIFGGRRTGAKPPELIIQDELHLISGPLGTLTGLYETAVDLLCSEDGVRPKVIASTATIRRAESQSLGLFNRPIRQFPPPGLDARNSFFAIEQAPDVRGSRMYFGLMASGVSQTTLLVRTYAALLQYAADLEADDDVRDAYWTLVGYFNSLRVLAGARMQVQDDVKDRIGLLARTAGVSPRVIDSSNRIELTSREPSGDIPDHLKRMATASPDPDALDVILATNMISVGMDIDRLGLMAVMGQPQSTSEYIQSTSRVGRKTPGLVAVLFNCARSRDRSHYESFVDYHAALYRQVESTSVTPFSARARDRGLHAVLVGLVRNLVPELRDNTAAGAVNALKDKLSPARTAILDRVRDVAPSEYDATAKQLDEIIDDWCRLAARNPELVYADFKHPDRTLLINAGSVDQGGEDALPTLWSLRDVDAASNLYPVD